MEKKKIFNLIIVDESGSMSCIERQTVSGMNETLQTIRMCQKENELQEHYVTLMTFSSDGVRMLYNAVPAEQATDIPSAMYNPSGCTPLYDAIGQGITELRRTKAATDSVLVTIVTDGEENSSTEYNHAAITALIEKMKRDDWMFTFIGANIDVKQTSHDLGIDACLPFCQDDEGTKAMFVKESESRLKFCRKAEHAMKNSKVGIFSKIKDCLSEEEYFD